MAAGNATGIPRPGTRNSLSFHAERRSSVLAAGGMLSLRHTN
jgi:hypothetical protein